MWQFISDGSDSHSESQVGWRLQTGAARAEAVELWLWATRTAGFVQRIRSSCSAAAYSGSEGMEDCFVIFFKKSFCRRACVCARETEKEGK